MLTLNPAPTFKGTARITVPGQEQPAEIQLTWKHKTREQYDAWMASAASFADQGGDAAFLAEVIADWASVDQVFSLGALGTLLAVYPAAGHELLAAYQTDLLASRAKN